MSSKGRSVKLYLVDGTATGILTAEIMNWTGHILAAPRTRIEDAFSRKELKRTGIYFLYGPDDGGSDLNKVYVGEGDEIGKRLYSHNKEKDFWERFIAVTSKDMNLTKAHVRYLEGRLLKILRDAKKVIIENKDMPQFDLLPEADIADMEAFLLEIQLVLPVVGAEFLRKPSPRVKAQSMDHADRGISPQFSADLLQASQNDIVFVLVNLSAGISAKATEQDGEFILLAGSKGSLKEKSSFHEKQKVAREEAFQSERATRLNEKNFVLGQDMSFSSPSAASVFLFGTSRNGRSDWIVEDSGKNYGTWKDEKIAANSLIGL